MCVFLSAEKFLKHQNKLVNSSAVESQIEPQCDTHDADDVECFELGNHGKLSAPL